MVVSCVHVEERVLRRRADSASPGQNSIYQEVGEYLDVRHENGSFVVVSSESTRFTNDFMVKQGFPNWYMFA